MGGRNPKSDLAASSTAESSEWGAQERWAFLAESSALLASSLDYETTLSNLASLAVPRVADWCVVELGTPPNTTQVAVAHVDPAKLETAKQLREEFEPDTGRGVLYVIETGKSVLYPELDEAQLAARAQSPRHLELLLSLSMTSIMLVPVTARGVTLGAIGFISTSSKRRFGPADLAMAERLGELAGLAIDNARLYQAERSARQKALEAVKLREDFLSIAGHELKTPLTALILQAEAAARAGDLRGKRAERLLRNADRLGRLVEELLDISRITRGGLALELALVDFGDLIRDVVARTSDPIARGGYLIDVRAPTGIRGAWDRVRMEQVVANLLSNALKYGNGRPIHIALDGDSRLAVLRIRDHGIGIALQDQQRIFERFERAVSPRHNAGLGLGLWIVREIVRAHGGSVTVSSAPGEGAEFRVTIPRHPPS